MTSKILLRMADIEKDSPILLGDFVPSKMPPLRMADMEKDPPLLLGHDFDPSNTNIKYELTHILNGRLLSLKEIK